MASELESLLVRLEADTAGLRRALNQADNALQGHERQTQRSLSAASKQFDKFNAAVTSKLQGIGSALAGVFALQSVRQDIIDVVALDRAAKLSGLTAAELQRLDAAARKAGLGGDAMADAMKELATKVGEVKTRSGGYYEFLRTHLPTVDAQIRGSKSTAEAMDIVAETVRRLSTAEERAVFIKQSLGEQALQLTGTLSQGAAGLRAAGDDAEKYGQRLSDSAIKNTKELHNEISDLTKTLDTRFKEALGAAAPFVSSFIRGLRDGISGDKSKMRDIVGAISGDAEAKKKLVGAGEAAGIDYAQGFAASAKKLLDSGAILPAADKLKLEVKLPDFSTEINYEAADALNDLRIKTLQAQEDLTGVITAEFDKELERFRRMLAEKLIDEKEYNQAREQLSIQAGAKIKEAYDKEKAEVKKLGEGFTNAMDSAFGDAFSQLLEKGKIDFKEFAASLIRDLAKVYVQMQILRPIVGYLGNGLAGMFGDVGAVNGAAASGGWTTTVAGARAEGGPVSAGKPYLVGERGPEIIVPRSAGTVIPNDELQRMQQPQASGRQAPREQGPRDVLRDFLKSREQPASNETHARTRQAAREPSPRDVLDDFMRARGQAREAGGPVSAGVPYLVGERGPEMVVPSLPQGASAPSAAPRSGQQTAGGSTTVYQIDARGADASVEQRIYRALAEVERARPSAPAQLSTVRRRFPTR